MKRNRASSLVCCGIVYVVSIASLSAVGDLRLVEAVKDQKYDLARALLTQKVDVNARQGDGATALHWAAHWNNAEMAGLLISAGANVNAATDLGVTPLYLAAEVGSAAMVKRLSAAGGNPNLISSERVSPLMLASRAGSLEAVEALLAGKADPNVQDNVRHQTALMWAVAHGHADVARALLIHGATVQARSVSGSMMVNRGDTDSGSLTQGGGNTPLLFAARDGDVECAKVLVEAGANVNDTAADGNSALVVAAHSGNGAFAAFLLDKGADVNANGAGYTVLHAAVLRDDLGLVKASLAHGANPNVPFTQATPMWRQSPDFFLSSALLGATPVLLAAQFGSVEMIRTLVAGGADLRLTAKEGLTPLMAGVVADHHLRQAAKYRFDGDERQEQEGVEAVRVLLELGADVNATNEGGNTALHAAASARSNPVIQLLADKGARLEAKNKRGQTPLALASAGGGRGRGAGNGSQANSTADLLRKLGAKE
jgi:ankyrin repeat protein